LGNIAEPDEEAIAEADELLIGQSILLEAIDRTVLEVLEGDR